MLFNGFQYWIFFLIVVVLFYSVPFRFGKILLLLASYVFYMWWDPRFIVLILTSTVVDYYLGIFLETASGRRKKLLLIVSLVVNLGILGFFQVLRFLRRLARCIASNSSVVSSVANRASRRRQLLHLRQSFLHL